MQTLRLDLRLQHLTSLFSPLLLWASEPTITNSRTLCSKSHHLTSLPFAGILAMADTRRTLPASRLQPASSLPATYSYKPLESDHHFRLLRFKKGKFDIVHANLDAPPEYETISYVWGPPKFDYHLSLANGETIAITESLYAAIPCLVAKSRTAYLWIDQLCIHQGDVFEKNHQVALMARIYRTCERVLIWLGAAENEIKAVVVILQKHEEVNPGHTLGLASIEAMFAKLELRESLEAARLEARPLLSHHWFRRAWVIQEAVLPKESLVIGGSRHCTFESLAYVLLTSATEFADLGRKEMYGFFSLGFMIQFIRVHRRKIGIPFHRILNILSPTLEASI